MAEIIPLFSKDLQINELTTLFLYICLLSIFLLSGKALRVKFKFFQRWFIPSSVIGGFIGLIFGPYLLGAFFSQFSPALTETLFSIRSGFSFLPTRLIDVVFATMFIGITIPNPKKLIKSAGAQYVYAMAIGGPMQYVIASIVTLFILIPFFKVDETFATILAIGFCGGHGTASGMAQTFRGGYAALNWSFAEGADLLFTSATVGILVSTIVGISLIKIGVKKGYSKLIKDVKYLPEETGTGIIPISEQYYIAKATVSPHSIEPFSFHVAIIFIAVFLGYLMDDGLALLGKSLTTITNVEMLTTVFKAIPTFPLAMVGGIIVQAFFVKTNKYHLLDAKTVERIRGVALDFLVVSAIASVSIPVVIHYFIPFSILLLAGTSYIVISTWFLAPKMLPQPWFERAIIEFGTQTGVTAMGLMLLRIVDPEFKTAALEPFALKQMVYEPFFGGGFITALTPLLILSMGLPTFLAIMLSISVIAIVLGILLGWFPNRASYQNKG